MDISIRIVYGFITTELISEKAFIDYTKADCLSLGMKKVLCGSVYKTIIYSNQTKELCTRSQNGAAFSLSSIENIKPDDSELRQIANHFELDIANPSWLFIAEQKQ